MSSNTTPPLTTKKRLTPTLVFVAAIVSYLAYGLYSSFVVASRYQIWQSTMFWGFAGVQASNPGLGFVGFFLSIPAKSTKPVEQLKADFESARETRLIILMTLSILLLAAALFVILSKRYPPAERHWAYATIGTIVGFWFGGT